LLGRNIFDFSIESDLSKNSFVITFYRR